MSFNEFVHSQSTLSNKAKGDAFEQLVHAYFKLDPKYAFYNDVWLFSKVPNVILEELGLPSQDIGIDLIAKTGDEYHAIQCKFHQDNTQSVTFKEVSTFISLLESNTKITKGYICSTADITSRVFNKLNTKPIYLLLNDTWQGLDERFFDRYNQFIQGKRPEKLVPYKPREHQVKALKSAKDYFVKDKQSRGKLIFPCGAGKSLTGYWITDELKSKRTIIAVPSLSLVKQTLDVYLREIVARGKKAKWLCICSDEGIGKDDDIVYYTENIGVPCQTDSEYIKNWLQENQEEEIYIFTTYQSGRIIAEVSKELGLTFDLGIFDEAHKTVGSDKKLFSHLLFEENIKIEKRIFMTATERFYRGSKDDIISMDDEDIYGDTFAHMSFKEAIETGLLTDYKVITIDIRKAEIAEFIKENNLVQLNDKWKKETEARSLASMLALRKAMKLFPIKNAVSFHSSIEKAVRNKELQTYITDTYNYKPIDTFTVSGKQATSKRNSIVQEFAKSEHSLITNARCLTEGVDVPNIDCIIFSDPRKSKVDIVQALGRALRKKEGKDWGYVILPVIYDDTTQEIDNENFQEILSIVRGLASNDERIVEYFKDKAEIKTPRELKENQFHLEVFSDFVDESELASQLQIKLWEKLSRFSWMPFEEAREYVRGLQLKSSTDFTKLWRQGKLPKNIPSKPRNVYKDQGFISMPDFLGYDTLFQDWMPFQDARKFVRSLKFKNEIEWEEYAKSTDKPKNIPRTPFNVYKNQGFVSMPDFLGYDSKFQDWLSYDDALNFVRKLNLKSTSDWRKYIKSNSYNIRIPKAPNNHYKDKGWVSFGTFLGTHVIADQLKKYFTYQESKEFLRSLELKSQDDFKQYKNSPSFNSFIPKMPEIKYRKTGDWKGWPDFLSYTRIHKWEFREFNAAREFVRKLELQNQNEWNKYSKSDKIPSDIPKAPWTVYSDWINMGDWLGTGVIASHKKKYLSYEDARKFARELKFSKMTEWKKFQISDSFPDFLPKCPDNSYKNKGWVSWPDFLGYDSKFQDWLNYDDALKIVHSKGIKSQKEWFEYTKSDTFDNQLPKTPVSVYKKEWKGWGEWLGTFVVAPQNKVFVDYATAKNILNALGIKNSSEWRIAREQNRIPGNIPSNPDKKYKDNGWKSWADFLGKEK